MRMSLETERLRLRHWRRSDVKAFAQLNADPEVMRYFPRVLSRDDSDQMAGAIQALIVAKGWGFWAVEVKGGPEFIGFVGLHQPDIGLPFEPCTEIGWRLARPYWGQGYATEAANRALAFAFDELTLEEVVSFTSTHNLPSMKVMARLGMQDTGETFFHPDLPQEHKLAEHVLYKITAQSWASCPAFVSS